MQSKGPELSVSNICAASEPVDKAKPALQNSLLVPTRCRTNDGTQRFVIVPIAQSGSPQGQYQYAPNQTYPRNQNKANATSYVIPFPLSQVSVIITPFQYPGTVCSKACLMLHQYLSCFHRRDFAIDLPFGNI